MARCRNVSDKTCKKSSCTSIFSCYMGKSSRCLRSFASPQESWATENLWSESAVDSPHQWLARSVPSSWEEQKFDCETNAVSNTERLCNQDELSSWACSPFQPQRVRWSQWNEMLREQLTVLCELCVMSWVACGEHEDFHFYSGFSWCQTPTETWAWERKRCQKGRYYSERGLAQPVCRKNTNSPLKMQELWWVSDGDI